jgi:hypothetical protein
MIVEDVVIAELSAARTLDSKHTAQCVNLPQSARHSPLPVAQFWHAARRNPSCGRWRLNRHRSSVCICGSNFLLSVRAATVVHSLIKSHGLPYHPTAWRTGTRIGKKLEPQIHTDALKETDEHLPTGECRGLDQTTRFTGDFKFKPAVHSCGYQGRPRDSLNLSRCTMPRVFNRSNGDWL